MSRIILVTGGSRSGKSAHALRLAESRPGPWTFVATCPAIDEEMASKIEVHQQERDARAWTTIEEEIDLAGAITRAGAGVAAGSAGVILVDCLTLWVNNLMYRASLAGREVTEQEVAGSTAAVVRAARSAPGTVIFVTNEVGLGIVPRDASTRLYRNLVGRCGQTIAAASDAAFLVVCGMPITLKGDSER
ncbi:MAG: bifunctional adenosylcobinamide kinase/adenosylcobinamide-phosphate guanylyltransferase [Candidatus Methylomirabilia bacterium]